MFAYSPVIYVDLPPFVIVGRKRERELGKVSRIKVVLQRMVMDCSMQEKEKEQEHILMHDAFSLA
jgi:hypothetical protein